MSSAGASTEPSLLSLARMIWTVYRTRSLLGLRGFFIRLGLARAATTTGSLRTHPPSRTLLARPNGRAPDRRASSNAQSPGKQRSHIRHFLELGGLITSIVGKLGGAILHSKFDLHQRFAIWSEIGELIDLAQSRRTAVKATQEANRIVESYPQSGFDHDHIERSLVRLAAVANVAVELGSNSA